MNSALHIQRSAEVSSDNHRIMDIHDLCDPLQSAYLLGLSFCRNFGNEVPQSIIEKGKCTVCSSLDLSSAIDTVYHRIFINRLGTLGIPGTALKCFISYLRNISL